MALEFQDTHQRIDTFGVYLGGIQIEVDGEAVEVFRIDHFVPPVLDLSVSIKEIESHKPILSPLPSGKVGPRSLTVRILRLRVPIKIANVPHAEFKFAAKAFEKTEDPDAEFPYFTYYFQNLPEDKGAASSVFEFVEEETSKYLKRLKKDGHVAVKNSNPNVSSSVRNAQKYLLEKHWPRTALALRERKGKEEILKAYILDHLATFKFVPRRLQSIRVPGDFRITHQDVAKALSSKRQAHDPLNHLLTVSWCPYGLFKLRPEELSTWVKVYWGVEMKARTLRDRVETLGLITYRE